MSERIPIVLYRFVGEMEELAAAFTAAGVPGEFHEAGVNAADTAGQVEGATDDPELWKQAFRELRAVLTNPGATPRALTLITDLLEDFSHAQP